jgi:hypothetical protein
MSQITWRRNVARQPTEDSGTDGTGGHGTGGTGGLPVRIIFTIIKGARGAP